MILTLIKKGRKDVFSSESVDFFVYFSCYYFNSWGPLNVNHSVCFVELQLTVGFFLFSPPVLLQ